MQSVELAIILGKVDQIEQNVYMAWPLIRREMSWSSSLTPLVGWIHRRQNLNP